MSTVRAQIIVERCAECPFFERTMVHALVEKLMKHGARSGLCRYNGIGQPSPAGRILIPDDEIVPPACPMRAHDGVIIQLKVKP